VKFIRTTHRLDDGESSEFKAPGDLVLTETWDNMVRATWLVWDLSIPEGLLEELENR
jgi:hypothetical protein